jgi:hypothetical protein
MNFDDVSDKTPTQEFHVAQGREVGEYALKYVISNSKYASSFETLTHLASERLSSQTYPPLPSFSRRRKEVIPHKCTMSGSWAIGQRSEGLHLFLKLVYLT